MRWIILNRPRDVLCAPDVPEGRGLIRWAEAYALLSMAVLISVVVAPPISRYFTFSLVRCGLLLTACIIGLFLAWRGHRWWSAFICAFFGGVIFWTLYTTYAVSELQAWLMLIVLWPYAWLYSMGPMRKKSELLSRR